VPSPGQYRYPWLSRSRDGADRTLTLPPRGTLAATRQQGQVSLFQREVSLKGISQFFSFPMESRGELPPGNYGRGPATPVPPEFGPHPRSTHLASGVPRWTHAPGTDIAAVRGQSGAPPAARGKCVRNRRCRDDHIGCAPATTPSIALRAYPFSEMCGWALCALHPRRA
jgi:hypothetical protein